MNIAFIRGPYLNNFELQSYYPLLKDKQFKLTGFASLRPMHKVKLPVKHYFSPVDLPNFPYKLQLLNRLFGDAMYMRGLEKGLKGYDIAHVRETYFHYSKQAVEAKKKGLIPKVLVTCSETIPFNHETIKGRPELKKTVRDNADYFHCLTNKAKVTLITEGVDSEKITVIPYGIERNRFQPGVFAPNPKELTLLFVGRLEDQKGVNELMEAWVEIRKNYPHVKLEIVGKGPLISEVKKAGLEPKQYPYEKMPEVMKKAHLLVLPSKPTKFWEEYFGMVLLEAMACGLPIVTTNCGAIPEVVWNAAMVVDHSNAQSLYKGIRFCIERDNVRFNMREKGLKRVEQFFDADKQAEKLGELYLRLGDNTPRDKTCFD